MTTRMMVGSSHQDSVTLTLMQAMTGTTADRAVTWTGDMAVVSIPDPEPEPPVQAITVPSRHPLPTQTSAVTPAAGRQPVTDFPMTEDGEDSRRRSASEVRRLLRVTADRLMQSQLKHEQTDATASGDDSLYTHSQERGSRTDITGRPRT